MSKARKVILMLFAMGLAALVAAGAVFYSKYGRQAKPQHIAESPPFRQSETLTLNIYYPKDGALQMEQRVIMLNGNATERIDAALTEFFKGPVDSSKPFVPSMVGVLGTYIGSDRILYVNLSDEFRRNFQGSAAYEFLLLKGLYETAMAAAEAEDVKVLVEGREIESLGGHLSLLYPLGESLSEVGTKSAENSNRKERYAVNE